MTQPLLSCASSLCPSPTADLRPLSAPFLPLCLWSELLVDCAQLVKANSIEGNKKVTGRVRIVYTPWSNLLKTGAMSTGQVGFKSASLVHYTDVDKRDNATVNRLMKTKVEKGSDSIRSSKEERDAEERKREKEEKRRRADEEKRDIEERKKDKAARSYDSVFSSDNMISNAEIHVARKEQVDEDFDFM